MPMCARYAEMQRLVCDKRLSNKWNIAIFFFSAQNNVT